MLGIFPGSNLMRCVSAEQKTDQHSPFQIGNSKEKCNESSQAINDICSGGAQDKIHLYWYQQARGVSAHAFEVKWAHLKDGNNIDAFTTLLKRLSEFPLRNCISATEVVEVIQAVVDSPIICKLVFEEVRDADSDCEHRPLSIFNTIQGLARFGKLENEGATQQELLELAKAIARQTILDEATLQMLKNRGNEEWLSAADETLEYQIALRRALGKELLLPFAHSLDSVGFSVFRVSVVDTQFALYYVNQHMKNVDRLVDVLVSQPIWKQYMERTCHAKKTEIDSSLGKRMDQLEKEKETSNSGNYNAAMRGLGLERERLIEDMLKAETKKLCIQIELPDKSTKDTEERITFCEIF